MGDSYKKLKSENAELRARVEDLEKTVGNKQFDTKISEKRTIGQWTLDMKPSTLWAPDMVTQEDLHPLWLMHDNAPTNEQIYFFLALHDQSIHTLAGLMIERSNKRKKIASMKKEEVADFAKDWNSRWTKAVSQHNYYLSEHRKHSHITPVHPDPDFAMAFSPELFDAPTVTN